MKPLNSEIFQLGDARMYDTDWTKKKINSIYSCRVPILCGRLPRASRQTLTLWSCDSQWILSSTVNVKFMLVCSRIPNLMLLHWKYSLYTNLACGLHCIYPWCVFYQHKINWLSFCNSILRSCIGKWLSAQHSAYRRRQAIILRAANYAPFPRSLFFLPSASVPLLYPQSLSSYPVSTLHPFPSLPSQFLLTLLFMGSGI